MGDRRDGTRLTSLTLLTGRPGQSCQPCPKNAAGSGMKANAHGFNSPTDLLKSHKKRENPMKPFLIILWVVVSGYLIFNLWRSHPQDSLIKRILWTAVLMIPFLGWIFYGGLYQVPEEQSPDMRAKPSSWIPGLGNGGPRND